MKALLAIAAGIGALLLILVIVAIGAGASIFGSQVQGEVDRLSREAKEKSAIHQVANSLGAQERFEKLYAEVKTADARVDTMGAALKRNPDDYTAQVNLTGAIGYCQQTREAYNALARTKTAEQFRSTDLPYQIDETTYDCKEAA